LDAQGRFFEVDSAFLDAQGRFLDGENALQMPRWFLRCPRVLSGIGGCFLGPPVSFWTGIVFLDAQGRFWDGENAL